MIWFESKQMFWWPMAIWRQSFIVRENISKIHFILFHVTVHFLVFVAQKTMSSRELHGMNTWKISASMPVEFCVGSLLLPKFLETRPEEDEDEWGIPWKLPSETDGVPDSIFGKKKVQMTTKLAQAAPRWKCSRRIMFDPNPCFFLANRPGTHWIFFAFQKANIAMRNPHLESIHDHPPPEMPESLEGFNFFSWHPPF